MSNMKNGAKFLYERRGVGFKKCLKHSATLVIMFLITLLPIFQYQASAHATLEKSTPQQQGVIKDKPEAIKLEFNEPVNTKYSSVTLFDDKGKRLKTLNQ